METEFLKQNKGTIRMQAFVGGYKKRPCTDCELYSVRNKTCKFLGKIVNPEWSYCSWHIKIMKEE